MWDARSKIGKIMLNIYRAHSYNDVEIIKYSIMRIPESWRQELRYIPWIILPNELSPLWIGLMTEEVTTHDGRLYSEIGGWWANEDVGRRFRFKPHIYITPENEYYAVHEANHALADIWNAPEEELFNPDKALWWYMASNAHEYFACGLDAFLYPEQDDRQWNKMDLAKADLDLYKYFEYMAA